MDEALILQKLDTLTNEIQLLKTGVVAELRKDMLPITRQIGPLVSDCLSDLDQEHRREDLVHFMRNMVLNVETLNSLLTTVKGAMELKNEMEPIAKLTLPKFIDFISEMSGMLTVAGAAVDVFKGFKISPEQAEAMSNVIRSINLSTPNRIGPVGALKKLYDPKVQETLGVMFIILEAVGAMAQAHRENQ